MVFGGQPLDGRKNFAHARNAWMIHMFFWKREDCSRSLTNANLESGDYDAFDGLLRAFEETWYLAHESRLTARTDRAIARLAGDDNTWKAKIGVLIEFAKGRGHDARTMGADYDLLSELAIPPEQFFV